VKVWPLALLLSACAAEPPPVVVEPPPPPPPVHEAPKRVALPVPPVPPSRAVPPEALDTVPATVIPFLSPQQTLTAAARAKAQADGYVGWRLSTAENINRLQGLVQGLDAAIAQMRLNEVGGHYKPADVAVAHAALVALRTFLATKGD
jgi:hypothetical protein